MAGLNLTGAVRGYMDGQRYKQQQDEAALVQKERDTMKMGDEAFAATIDTSKAEWAMSGAQGEYKPSDATMLKAAEARGMALAKAGSWKGYMQNETTLMPQRIRIRSNAMAKYEEDGDFEALLKATHQTIADGKDVVEVRKSGGMPELPSIGREATPPVYAVKFSDGVEKEVKPERFIAGLKLMNTDPEKAAEREMELNFKRAVANIEAEKQKEVKREEGDQARKTLGTKYELDEKLENVKFGQKQTLADADHKAAGARTAMSAGATVKAAELGKQGRIEGAKISKGDQKDKGAADKVKDFKAVHDEVTRYVGERSDFGAGRISNEGTNTIAAIAKKAIDAGAEPEDAIASATAVYMKNNPQGVSR